METNQAVKKILAKHRDILLCILFGSVAGQKEKPSSDLDIAIACNTQIDAQKKQALIKELAMKFGRPVDLIDLQITSGTLLHQILTKGTIIFCNDHQLYAKIMKRMLFNQADMMPYHHRILKRRREKWINE
jgi:predicted nucleotidyltransferase